MNYVTLLMAGFSLLGAADRILGNKFGLGKEFERGLMLLGTMALSMIGMLVLAPLLAELLKPALQAMSEVLPFDPSIIPASLLANDMGGAPLSVEVAKDPAIGAFNAMVVSSMMGCTISFTIPFALGLVDKSLHRETLIGLLCGLVTIPAGCLAAGLVSGIAPGPLLLNLIPLILFSGLTAWGLLKIPNICVAIFHALGVVIKILITFGLAIGIFTFLTGIELLPGVDTFENTAGVVLNAAAVMTGAFPLLFVLSKLLTKPLQWLGQRIGINSTAATGLFSTLASSMITFPMLKDMDQKGVVLNSAFAVSAAFTFAGHLAYTLAVDASYLFCMIVGKLVAGVLAVCMALLIYRRVFEKKEDN
ncbi:MAG: ethanolamine utilization protein EutH [Clostridia bacterium]|nr:ethanolamine utilization protein EutH [Clostridia bacterium]